METTLQQPKERIRYIDLARGVAVSLMILSHGVKALLPFDRFAPWGLVPIHLITKFSSSLFFMVFGLSLAMIFVPFTEGEQWPEKRKKLVLRGIVILFWYKILSIIELFQYSDSQRVLDTMLYKSFASFVEILGYYAIAFLWIPWVLPVWRKLPTWSLFLVPPFFLMMNFVLSSHFNFWGIPQIKAMLVEEQSFYTWGQLARAPLVFLGMIIGTFLIRKEDFNISKTTIGVLTILIGICLSGLFYYLYQAGLQDRFIALAMNEGKHPPTFDFMLFSIAGAFSILGICIWGGNSLAALLKPITMIGEDALQSFIFHIFVIFVVYRYLLGLFHNVSYINALYLALLLIVLTPVWIGFRKWVLRKS